MRSRLVLAKQDRPNIEDDALLLKKTFEEL